MHKYLRAVGFSSITKRKELETLIRICANEATERAYTSNSDDTMLAVFSKDFAPGMGISICGEYDENNHFSYDYSFPYLKGNGISSYDDLTIERHADKISFAGVCDDINIGVSLIFYLQNMIPYIRTLNCNQLPLMGTSLTLSALSVKGSIMMPLKKDEKQKQQANRENKSRKQLVEAARKGEIDAIESLTLEDMDTYSTISKKIQKEDVFSIVDTYFMPYGIECDQYSVLGEILDLELVENYITKEKIYKMEILCNGLKFDLCINKMDLFGEPAIGRRFKGYIWLQGFINFP